MSPKPKKCKRNTLSDLDDFDLDSFDLNDISEESESNDSDIFQSATKKKKTFLDSSSEDEVTEECAKAETPYFDKLESLLHIQLCELTPKGRSPPIFSLFPLFQKKMEMQLFCYTSP